MENIQLLHDLEKEIRELSEMEKKIRIRLQNAPEGSLYINQTQKGKYIQYYLYHEGKRIYLPVKEHSKASSYAQKEYDEKVIEIIRGRLQSAKHLLEQYKRKIVNEYAEMPAAKRKLIIPIEPTDEAFVKEWYDQHPDCANPYPIHSELYTERGEMVRSKSEKILADLFYRRKIPYVYEPKLELGNGKTIYPDFLLLDVERRKTYIYEHFGMMDSPDYVKGAMEKLGLYSEQGYWYGDTLLFSFETSVSPLNTKNVERMLSQFLQ